MYPPLEITASFSALFNVSSLSFSLSLSSDHPLDTPLAHSSSTDAVILLSLRHRDLTSLSTNLPRHSVSLACLTVRRHRRPTRPFFFLSSLSHLSAVKLRHFVDSLPLMTRAETSRQHDDDALGAMLSAVDV